MPEEEISEKELRELMGPAAASSIGFDPRRETPKQKREFAKRRREVFDEYAPKSGLVVRSAREAMAGVDDDERTTPSSDAAAAGVGIHPSLVRRGALLGEYWREGELVVLVGASGVGKSVLAMQVADAAARDVLGLNGADERTTPSSDVGAADVGIHPSFVRRGASRVLYIDLERSEAQRVERYSGILRCEDAYERTTPSAQSGVHPSFVSRGALKYEFAEGLEWADVGSFGVMHSRYRGSVARFLVDSVYEEIRNREPDVVIIDNLTYLMRAGRRSTDLPALMKTLRRGVNDTGISVMLLAHSDARVGRSKFLDEKNYHVGFELADRVVALCHSTMDRSFRYVKTVFPAAAVSEEVAAYQIVPGGFEFVGMMEEEAHRRNYREHVALVNSAIKRVEDRFGGRRRKFRAAVPSRLELKGIE